MDTWELVVIEVCTKPLQARVQDKEKVFLKLYYPTGFKGQVMELGLEEMGG